MCFFVLAGRYTFLGNQIEFRPRPCDVPLVLSKKKRYVLVKSGKKLICQAKQVPEYYRWRPLLLCRVKTTRTYEKFNPRVGPAPGSAGTTLLRSEILAT